MINRYLILLSGGVGSRFGAKIPKQYTNSTDGKTFIEHSFYPFRKKIHLFSKIVVVCDSKYKTLIRKVLNIDSKILQFVDNGKTRQDSINNGIEYLRTFVDITKLNQVFIQEAVRPFVLSKIVDKLIDVDHKFAQVTPSVPPLVAYWMDKDNNGYIIPKESLKELQLPKRYDLSKWLDWTKNKPYNINAIDESSLFLENNISIKHIEGSHLNIKITLPEHKNISSAIAKLFEKEYPDK